MKSKIITLWGGVEDNSKAGIDWKALQDKFINLERGHRRKTNLAILKIRTERILVYFTKERPKTKDELFKKYEVYIKPFIE